jgi:ribonucleoside-diphosphate reductase alpha chain
MGVLKVDHPDILEFIQCKLNGGIANFNISVTATDAFMEALEADSEYDLIDPHTHKATGRLRARDVFDRIVDAAWRTGDPGLVFIDRVNRSPANPVPELETIEATNPCGEQPLAPNDACNLGSINLDKFGRPENQEAPIAWDELERVVRLSVRFLDDVIQVNPYPLPEIMEEVHANRRIGLGVMGWADLLIHGDDHRPHGDDQHHRRLLLGDRAALRRRLQPHRRRPAPDLREPALRGSGQAARLLQS